MHIDSPAGWMYARHGGQVRAEVRAGDLAVWPAREPVERSQEDQLREQAQKWVSQTFFGTLLKQMRNSPFKSEVFSGGRGGEVFSNMLDQHLADRMARGSGRRLADSIVRKLLPANRREVEAPAESATPGAGWGARSAGQAGATMERAA
jgi:Rod binding domain-containing protein